MFWFGGRRVVTFNSNVRIWYKEESYIDLGMLSIPVHTKFRYLVLNNSEYHSRKIKVPLTVTKKLRCTFCKMPSVNNYRNNHVQLAFFETGGRLIIQIFLPVNGKVSHGLKEAFHLSPDQGNHVSPATLSLSLLMLWVYQKPAESTYWFTIWSKQR